MLCSISLEESMAYITNWMKENREITTCSSQLDLETLGFWSIMPEISGTLELTVKSLKERRISCGLDPSLRELPG